MADWLQYDPNTLPWMRRSGEAAREATQAFQFGAQQAARQNEQRKDEAYRSELLKIQQETIDLKRLSEIQSAQGMVELSKTLSEISHNDEWDKPSGSEKFWKIIAKHPSLRNSPHFDNLVGNFTSARQAAARAELEIERQSAITDRNQANIDARFTALDERFNQVLQLEGVKSENRKEFEELRNELNMLRDQFKPLSSGSDRFDLPYSKQLEYQARLDAINDDLKYIRDPKGRDDAIKALTKEYEPYRIDRRGEGQQPASSGTRIRDKATGKEFIYRGSADDVPKDKYDILP